MHEMLGNQYFLARNYFSAAENLEKALWKTPGEKTIRRRLIICYTQIGRIEKALELFLNLIKEDIDFITNVNLIDDDCPCSELIFDIENKAKSYSQSVDTNIVLGILWLFCDIDRSINYFEQAHSINK
jgi:pentatricopeptide repeat protein